MNKYAKLFKKVRVSKNPYRYIDKKYKKLIRKENKYE